MTPEELREACEAAGLRTRDKAIAPGWEAGSRQPGCEWWYDDDDPALPAYVASLLVAKVMEVRGEHDDKLWLAVVGTSRDRVEYATTEQRIRAAMAVLKESSG